MPDERREMDRAWREKMLVQMTQQNSKLAHLEEQLEKFIEHSDKRVLKIEHAVFGNGAPGLTEKVRGLTARWATGVSIVTFITTFLANKLWPVVAHALAP